MQIFVTLGTFIQFVNFCTNIFVELVYIKDFWKRRTRVDTRVKTVDWYLREGDRVEISELKDATGFSFENRRWTIGILIEESGRVVLLELKDASGFS